MRRIAALLACLALAPWPAPAAEITVFAAASLGDVLDDAAAPWAAATGHSVTVAPAGSAVLARQIAQGAPADLFVSANADWMDWLAARGLIDPATRRDLATNALVLVAHGQGPDSATELGPATDIAAMLPRGARLATALTDAVPAGIYARAALETLGQWRALEPRLAQTDNVRTALALVALGEAPLGIVYATDAQAEARVHLRGRFPPESHPPIRYPAAVCAEAADPAAALALLDWLSGPEAQAIFRAQGFGPAPDGAR